MLRVQASFHAVNLLFMDSHEKMCEYNYGMIKSVLHETSYDEDFNIGFSFLLSLETISVRSFISNLAR